MQLPRPIPTGTVKKWWPENGFGFITPDDGSEDAFCHWSSCLDGNEPQDGDKVEYELEWDDRKGKYNGTNVSLKSGGGGGKDAMATSKARTRRAAREDPGEYADRPRPPEQEALPSALRTPNAPLWLRCMWGRDQMATP